MDSVDSTDSTRLMRRAPVAKPAQASTRGAGQTSALEALRSDMIVRHRLFARNLVLFMILSAAFVPLLGGDSLAKQLMVGGMVVSAAVYGWLLIKTRDPTRYDDGQVMLAAAVSSLCATLTVYYFGVFSPAPALLALGMFLYAQGARFGHSLVVLGVIAGGHAVMATLILAGVLDDRGLIRGAHLSVREQVLVQVFMLTIYLGGYIVARGARKSVITAVSELENAVRQIAHREALLNEARQDLARALQVGGPGRFTGQAVGSFVLGNLIGRGGMGEVYEAIHADTGDEAALKLMHLTALADPGYVERFTRELRAAAQVESPNVVHVLEVSGDGDALPFLAMERLRGESLADLIRKGKRMSLAEVVTMVMDVSAGLAAARVAGIVHRDLKPGNLFLANGPGRPVWKILDFSVATHMDQEGTLTRGQAVGTPAYMSPEQARGRSVDHRADLYALAANAYRALTGRPAFTGKDVAAVMYAVVHKLPPRPSEIAELPLDVDAVLAIGLAKDPNDRFSTAEEFASALADAARADLSNELRDLGHKRERTHPWGTTR